MFYESVSSVRDGFSSLVTSLLVQTFVKAREPRAATQRFTRFTAACPSYIDITRIIKENTVLINYYPI